VAAETRQQKYQHQNQERREIRLAAKERNTRSAGSERRACSRKEEKWQGKNRRLASENPMGNKSGVQAPRLKTSGVNSAQTEREPISEASSAADENGEQTKNCCHKDKNHSDLEHPKGERTAQKHDVKSDLSLNSNKIHTLWRSLPSLPLLIGG
jgi:hypothetical protein